MKQKSRHGNRNHCLGKRTKEGKPIENDMQKEIPIPHVGKIQSISLKGDKGRQVS